MEKVEIKDKEYELETKDAALIFAIQELTLEIRKARITNG